MGREVDQRISKKYLFWSHHNSHWSWPWNKAIILYLKACTGIVQLVGRYVPTPSKACTDHPLRRYASHSRQPFSDTQLAVGKRSHLLPPGNADMNYNYIYNYLQLSLSLSQPTQCPFSNTFKASGQKQYPAWDSSNQCDQIGRFFALWAIIQRWGQQLFYPNWPHCYTIFVKVSKSIIFLVKSFLGNFYRHLAIFIWSHW